MVSMFEQTIAANLPVFQAVFGVTGTATAPDGTVTANVALRVHRNQVRQVERKSGVNGEMQVGEILVQQGTGAGQMPNVVKGHRFAFAAQNATEVWTVEMTPEFRNGEFVCTVTRAGVNAIAERRAKE